MNFKKAFECLEEQDFSFKKEIEYEIPDEDGWDRAKTFCKFLKTFYGATKRLSGPEGSPIHGNGSCEGDNENTVEQPNALELANIQNSETSDAHSLMISMWGDLIRQPGQIFHNVNHFHRDLCNFAIAHGLRRAGHPKAGKKWVQNLLETIFKLIPYSLQRIRGSN
ncbi:hypothetical protein QJS04_geneDACA016264 [Acorus gramineus]|uniref:Uncharacterized protein n=1 Tax=Acorus gramineus TaxID=55184 RepID=A0AAV9AJA8_ACOGR|nr:hypothetical protein QJS04_geneDACA016264 [Acorus gramineus]